MPARQSIYRRLTGRRRGLFGYSQLWLAPDHILLLTSSRFAEDYQRFALADVQSIVVTELPDRTVAQIALIAAAAILWGVAVFAVSSTFARGFFLAAGALAMAIALTDILRGRRCHSHLYTAVSRQLLPPVSRMRAARAFLAEIRPVIEAVQGRLDHLPAEAPATAVVDIPPEVPRPPDFLPEILFAVFLIDAALWLTEFRFPRHQFGSALPTTFFAEIVLVIVALVRRAGRDTRRLIYAVMIAALVCIGWDAVNLGRGFVTLVTEASRGPGPQMLNWKPMERGQAIFAVAWRAAAGAIGLVAAWVTRTP
jgi:hypothetical protein